MPDKLLQCTIFTPEANPFDGPIELCVLPAVDGEWMIEYNHAPSVILLGMGTLRLKTAQGTRYFYLKSGVAHVKQNAISILSDMAVDAGKLSQDQIQKELQQLEQKTPQTKEETLKRTSAIREAKAKLQTLHKMAGV